MAVSERNIYFMALGGAQSVGASCYYLKLGKWSLLLDAGIGYEHELIREPNLLALRSSSLLESMSQINEVYFSHAHMDHIGFMPKLIGMIPNVSLCMTETTEQLMKLQLYDRRYLDGSIDYVEAEGMRLAMQKMFSNVVYFSYFKYHEFGKYRTTFFPAGHIPGASMIQFEYMGKKILYTGDFSCKPTPLTDSYQLPINYHPDILIMCGLHAKHVGYKNIHQILYQTVTNVIDRVDRGGFVFCRVKQLSKGIEFLKCLTQFLDKAKKRAHMPIYLDKTMFHVVEKMERLSIPMLTSNVHSIKNINEKNPHIVIAADLSVKRSYHSLVEVDFTLHADFQECVDLIKRLNPKLAIVVHCAADKYNRGCSVEQEVLKDGDCRTQFIFAEEQELYKL